jgi:hypothetical protein
MQKSVQQQFLELLNTYPSPHNGQPIRLREVSPGEYTLHFQKERGLQATDISLIFSFVSMGVFIGFAEACGQALGHTVDTKLALPSNTELKGSGLIKFADMSVKWNSLEPNNSVRDSLKFRQTSRKKYYEGLNNELTSSLGEIASQESMRLKQLSRDKAHQAIWLNQRAVFDDMFDPAVNRELNNWLRYSKKEKETKRDGLAYDCMEINGSLMKFIVSHPGILKTPLISKLLKSYYLRTMSDESDVYYMMSPFDNELQAFQVGKVVADIWLAISNEGYYLHPFGTIMSNHDAHRDFIRLAGEDNESRDDYLVFIFRAGKSESPVRSLRLDYNHHLLIGGGNV